MTNRIACIIGTAGHVDHGKSSLIKALTGIDTDTLAEEKRRGLSIELGFARIDLDDGDGQGVVAAVVDVPGHERFIRNMLAGITGVDMVLFVVAADDGVMAQSREHLDIVRLLGVTNAIFVITKCDLVEAERPLEVEAELKELIRATPLEGSPVVMVSTLAGDGIEDLKGLIRERLRERPGVATGLKRLPVDRSFAVKGFGTVVTGTVASGEIKKGDTLICCPGGAAVKVRGLESLHTPVDSVGAGERAALNISGIGYREIKRGAMLVCPELGRFAARIAGGRARFRVDCFLDLTGGGASGRKMVKKNAILKLHHLTGETLVRLHRVGEVDGSFGGGGGGGGGGFGRLFLERPLLMLRGDRFILRDPATNTTIGGGTVYLPYPGAPPRLLKAPRDGDDLHEALGRLLGHAVALDPSMLGAMLNLGQSALEELVNWDGGEDGGDGPLKRGYRFNEVDGVDGAGGELLLNRDRVAALKRDIIEALTSFHVQEPIAPGMGEARLLKVFAPRLYAGLGKGLGARLFKVILEEMLAEGGILRVGSALRMPSHTPASRGPDAAIEEGVLALFSGLAPLNMEAVGRLPFKAAELKRVMGYLEEKGRIVKLRERCFISGTAIEVARERLTAHMEASGTIKASEFRDLLGCGRKLAIEILEYFDKSRVTLRKGDLRTLR
jgi:selenocysteine-specific elongation factor